MPASSELDRLRVVLVDTRNPLNIGAVARAISNFGFHRLRLVNPYEVAFREARSAVGASHVLAAAEQYRSLADAVADCSLIIGTTAVRHRELQHPLRVLNAQSGLAIRKALREAPVALLFGSEKYGLSNEDLSHCHWLLRIPTREGHVSMNLGQAVAVCLYELVRPARVPTKEKKMKAAAASKVELVSGSLLQALQSSGYVKKGTENITAEKVRRLVRRLSLQSDDADLLLGMLRQILWKTQLKQ